MHCPKCGTENPDDARSCSSCGHTLTNSPATKATPQPKRSKIAVSSFLLGILSSLFFVLILKQTKFPGPKGSEILSLLFSLLGGALAIILGIAGLEIIVRSRGQMKGISLAVAGIAVPAVMLFVHLKWPPVWRSPPHPLTQKNQFHTINVALELFRAEFDGFPPSDALDPISRQYCGAMKLAEAMMGQDLKGCHQDSIFRSDGQDGSGRDLYPVNPPEDNLKARKEHYLPLESAEAYKLKDIFPNIVTTAHNFNGDRFVLCDVYTRVTSISTGRRIGMPVLYYKADTSKTAHNLDNPDDPNNIYNYGDNHALLGLGAPWNPNKKHPLFTNPKIFYEITRNKKVKTKSSPHRADSFILISAGYDGLYGTKDDIVNFDR
ncbi:MAG: zinc ribbon domain-containing protein [Planctomycetota bacterium]|jgi:hypothetical protein